MFRRVYKKSAISDLSMMDNRQFNVNGRGLEMLKATLRLACLQEGGFDDQPAKVEGWVLNPKHGLILLWSTKGTTCHRFFAPLDWDIAAEMVFKWLQTKEAKEMACEGWDRNEDHDGSNEYGWRVYCEDWGHVGEHTYSICAVRPSWNWLGK
jgi:hypothetical protein